MKKNISAFWVIAVIIAFSILLFGGEFAYFKYYSNVETKEIADWKAVVENEPWYNEATFYKGLAGNFLILDQGTAPFPRGLIIYDLSAKKTILQDEYSLPLDIKSDEITYWTPTSIKVTAENCPEAENWYKDGLGAEIEKYVFFDLKTLTKKDLGQLRCQPTQ